MRAAPRDASGCQPDILGGYKKERFDRCLRLLKPADFKQVFSGARKSTDENFTVLAIDNRLTHPRLGLAIAKKEVKSAVVRNRIKRVVRESFRRHRAVMPALDLVVLARRGTAEKDNSELYRSLQRHWSRLGHQCAR